MITINPNISAFLELISSGLWEKEARLLSFEKIDYSEIYRLAQEQSITGLVAAGLEHVADIKPPKEVSLLLVGEALQLEKRNTTMNHFIGVIVEKMRNAGIYTLLIKGQGIAQCYERPLWRACGDVDFFLSTDNYSKAKDFLISLASNVEDVDKYKLHLPMTIDTWHVELHGTLRSGLWKRIDRVLNEIQEEIFFSGSVRTWMNGGVHVFLPRADEDVVYVFSHILKHFFRGGIGLRQICDWCRLLWVYKDSLNQGLLEKRIRKMGLMSEWKAFCALAVNSLGMPVETMPFYSPQKRWKRKADKILSFIIETGNFGHNRDNNFYYQHHYLVYKLISFWRHTKDGVRYFMIFPVDSIKVWWSMFVLGMTEVIKGK